MKQLIVEMAAPDGRLEDVLEALSAVMRPARLDRHCASASVWQASEDGLTVVRYVEEWSDDTAFETEARGERVGRLLEVMEMAAESPLIEVRSIADIRGLDYFTAARAGRPRHDESADETPASASTQQPTSFRSHTS